MKINPELHHRRSIRLREYDYTQPGAYFITIVTSSRKCIFSFVNNGQLLQTDTGKIIQQEWEKVPHRFPSTQIDTFIVMPNHFHGIIFKNSSPCEIEPVFPNRMSYEKFGKPVKNSIPTIIRSFKASTTLRYRQKSGDVTSRLWQTGYYEHVIREENDLNRIREYIDLNPDNWLTDPEYHAYRIGNLVNEP